tara:strand:- start:515 stop:865 length:351 start_codon:yes stop_codon:yes gene_type:complete
MESPSPRNAFEVMDLVIHLMMDKMKAWIKETLPVKKHLTSEEQKEASIRFKKEAFEEINPPEFKTQEELSTAFSKELDDFEAKMMQDINDRIAATKAAEQKKLDTSPKGLMGSTQV